MGAREKIGDAKYWKRIQQSCWNLKKDIKKDG